MQNPQPRKMAEDNALEREIRRLIAAAGPMPVADYMRLCLSHPRHGYYVARDPFGRGGDFITAPEISQMFGELIGIWMAAVWRQMGAPENVRVVELGPGRGTLMADALRAARVVKGFREAIVLHLVEISPALQELQRQRLEALEIPMLWHAAIEEVPGGPSIIIANEFIDALPIHQAVKQADGWHERVVEVGPDGKLRFGLAREALPHFDTSLPRPLRQSPPGSIYEWRADRIALELGRHVRKDGAALVLDYGHVTCGLGETLQAVAGHAYADPLQAPGEADLTAHVDFEALAQSAESIGSRIHGPILQRELLARLGIDKRAAALKAHAPRDKALEIDMAVARLTESGAKGMGELFKALAIADPKLGALPGFETPS
jgi:SAM-dependent MidA family methyltransferase